MSRASLTEQNSDFHRHPAIRQALLTRGVGAFVITSHKNKTADDLVALIVKAWPAMQRLAEGHPVPFIAKILGDGRVIQVD